MIENTIYESKILSSDDVQRMLSVGRNTIYRLLSSGEIEAFKINGRWKITEESVRKYIEEKNKPKNNIE